jgi:beta-lactamase regulating signal transducer with metallopeptidase domain
MTNLFLTVLNMSVTAAFVIAALCVARFVLQKIRAPKWISYALWAVAGLNLASPFKLKSAFSLIPFNSEPIPQDIAMQAIPRINSGIGVIDNAVSSALPAAAPAASVNPLQIWTALGAYVWLFGVAAMLIYAVISYVRLIRRKDSVPTPFVYGFIKPKIHIPTGLAGEELRYVTLHEQTHIKRHDHIVKMFAFALLCVHWFNPLVYVARRELDRACELSCDEAVIRSFDESGIKDYGNTLLSVAAESHIPRAVVSTTMVESKQALKERLGAIMKSKKRGVAAVCVSVVLVVVLAACAVALGAGSGFDGNNYNFSGFSFNGFTLGGDSTLLDLSDRSKIAPLGVENSYAYNYDKIRFDTDDSGRITRFYITVHTDDVTMSVAFANGSSGIGYSVTGGTATIEQIEQSLGGTGKKGWQDREQKLRYEEYTDAHGITVRFVYTDDEHGLIWVIADGWSAEFGDASPSPAIFAATVYVWGEGERPTPNTEVIPATPYFRYAVYSGTPILTESDVYGSSEVFISTSDVTSALAKILDSSQYFTIRFLQMNETDISKEEMSAIAESATRPFSDFNYAVGVFDVAEASTADPDIIAAEEIPSVFENSSYEQQMTDYLTVLFNKAYSPYYGGLRYEITNYAETLDGDNYTATFYWTMYHRDSGGDISADTGRETSGNFSLQATAKTEGGKIDFQTLAVLGGLDIRTKKQQA